MRPDAHEKLSKFKQWLSILKKWFGVDSVSDDIISALAQPAIKSFSR
jgi:hypothetical protein